MLSHCRDQHKFYKIHVEQTILLNEVKVLMQPRFAGILSLMLAGTPTSIRLNLRFGKGSFIIKPYKSATQEAITNERMPGS